MAHRDDAAGARRLGPSPLSLLSALAFLVTVDTRIMTPLLPAMAASLATSVTAMGLAMTVYMLPYEGIFLWGGFTYLGVVAVARFGLNRLFLGICGVSLLGLGALTVRLLGRPIPVEGVT